MFRVQIPKERIEKRTRWEMLEVMADCSQANARVEIPWAPPLPKLLKKFLFLCIVVMTAFFPTWIIKEYLLEEPDERAGG